MSTPRTDAACGWPWGHHGRIESSDLRWSPDGPFVHSEVARHLERENVALAEENRRLHVELDAYHNGEQLRVLRDCVDRTGEANDKLVIENAALRAQDAWLIATFGNREDENQKLRAELEAQAVVNGKGGEREAKLLSIISRIRRVIDQELDWSQAQRLEKAGELCDEVLRKEAQP